ncbi:hypothetical protein FRB98_003734 [Tulasnella sp. 332]|nr:hypothetical protein FRB98_003734 [Tulasnella sp. 332]
MFDLRYRIWLFKNLAKLLLPPTAASLLTIRLISSAYGLHLHTVFTATACLFSIPIWWTVDSLVSRWNDERSAKRASCSQPPLLEGKSLGNMDLAKRFGNGLNYDYPGYIFNSLLDEAGANTARVSFLGTPMLLTRDPKLVQYVLSTGFSKFHRGETWGLALGSFFKKGIFMTDGEPAKWVPSSKCSSLLCDFDAISKNSDKVISLLKGKAVASEPCDVQDIFERFTMDTAGEFLFGNDELNTLSYPLRQPRSSNTSSSTPKDYGGFVNAYTEANRAALERYSFPPLFWTMRDLFNDPLAPPIDALSDYLEPLAIKALELKRQRQVEKHMVTEEVSYSEHLAASTDDVKLIKDQLLNMMLAARDTVRIKIIDKCGLAEAPAYEDIKQLKYLRAVIDETLRIFPPVTNNLREYQSNGVVPTMDGPMFIAQKGMKIMWSYPAMHRRKDLWGEDAEEFNPERWMGDRAPNDCSKDCQFMPFHGGPRICLGMDLAYNESSFVLIRILQTFDSFTVAQAEAGPLDCLPPAEWKTRKGREATEEFWPGQGITMFSNGGMWLRMHVAQ